MGVTLTNEIQKYLIHVRIHTPESIHLRITFSNYYSCDVLGKSLRVLTPRLYNIWPLFLLKFLKICQIGCWSLLDNHFQVLPSIFKKLSLGHSGTHSNSNCVLGYCPAERWIRLPVFGGKQTHPGFTCGVCLCLAPFHVFCILKKTPVLIEYKHIYNMMQPICLKIWIVVLSNVLYWICLNYNTL